MFLLLLFIVIGSFILVLSFSNNKYTDTPFAAKVTKNNSGKKEKQDGITMFQAYQLGLKEARKIDDVCELIYIGSVDDGKNSGQNGKKENWNMILGLLNQKKRLIVSIEKSKLKKASVIEELNEPTIKNDEIKIDSNTAVEKVIQDFSLLPGQNVISKGYHFRLFKEDNNIFLSIIGSKNQKEAEIFLDGRTGNYLGRTQVK
jgi:hypothetical protein